MTARPTAPRKPLRRLLPWLLAGVAALLLYQAMSGPRGLLKISDLRDQQQGILREIDSLEARKQELIAEKARLLTDTNYLEKLARKELGMARPGEKVYRFVGGAPPASPPPSGDVRPVGGSPSRR
jgi:cell division protein FtsB